MVVHRLNLPTKERAKVKEKVSKLWLHGLWRFGRMLHDRLDSSNNSFAHLEQEAKEKEEAARAKCLAQAKCMARAKCLARAAARAKCLARVQEKEEKAEMAEKEVE